MIRKQMSIGIALDIGTSGLRGQAVDCSREGKIIATAVTRQHPLAGGNVIDHLDFAVRIGTINAQQLLVSAVNSIIDSLGLENSPISRFSICGNPIQLSIFQGIEIRDLAYAGQTKLDSLGITPPNRDARVLKAEEIAGLKLPADAKIIIPPAVHHEIGADTLAMLIQSGILDRDETAIATDYGTNAEMALKVGDIIYTASTAAGPAIEGQQIEAGMLALPGAICDVVIDSSAGVIQNWVLDNKLLQVEGDTVDYISGEIIKKGQQKGVGLTGTGVIALLDEGPRTGLILLPNINTQNGAIRLSKEIIFNETDLLQAGRAIGAFRAGHVTLCKEAGIDIHEIGTAYMCGAAGTYVNVLRAQGLGLVPAFAKKVYKAGNTSLAMARDLLWDETYLEKMQQLANKLKAEHCMLASSKIFKNAYLLELSYWTEGMPLAHYQKFAERYGFFDITTPPVEPEVILYQKNDLGNKDDQVVIVVELVKQSPPVRFVGCTGCQQCEVSCPENAITVDSGPDGFQVTLSYPHCYGLSCRKCEKGCPEKVFSYLDLISCGNREDGKND